MRHARQTLTVTLVLFLLLAAIRQAAAGNAGSLRAAPALRRTPKPIPNVPGGLSECDPDGVQASGAIYRICMPPWWWYNGDLVIWAHGYVDFTQPVAIPEDQLCLDGLCIPDVVNSLGYAFATTSYSTNGLAVTQGLADIVDLVDIFTAEQGAPDRVILIGASEGGLITTLAIEQYPGIFDGGLAMCGPIGDFAGQVNYFGDFRVVFDVFFPGLMPGSPVNIPPGLIANWDAHYSSVIEPAIQDPANQPELRQLVRVTRIPFDRADRQATMEESIQDSLWYNVFATNDANEKLGGQPFDNQNRHYKGSFNDPQLNQLVARFAADQAALDEIEAHYQTSGVLAVPLVTLHTTLDQQVPYWHETLYGQKVSASGSDAFYQGQTVDRYGHCQFEFTEILDAFDTLLGMISGVTPQPAGRLGLRP